MITRFFSTCAGLGTILLLSGCIAQQSPVASVQPGTAGSPQGLNARQPSGPAQQARREQAPVRQAQAGEKVLQPALPPPAGAERPRRADRRAVAQAGDLDCPEPRPRSRRRGQVDRCRPAPPAVVARRPRLVPPLPEAETVEISSTPRSINPGLGTPGNPLSPGTPNPPSPIGPTGPTVSAPNLGAGGPGSVGSPSFEPLSPTAAAVATAPSAAVPLANNQLVGTPTSSYTFSPAPSTPRTPNAPSPPDATPSGTIRDVLGNVRR